MHDANTQLLLAVTAALLVIVVAAQVCGRLARRAGQPAVVGEMIAGVLLGPTVLGALAPSFSNNVFSATTKPTLYVISMIGLSLYMFLVGLEHEYQPGSRREAAIPVVLSVGGLVFPLVVGGVSALYLAADYRPEHIGMPLFVLFVVGALSLTAFPMLARVLQERRMMHTRFGGVAVRTAAIDDVMAWCILAAVSALVVHDDWTEAWRTAVPAILFVIVAFAGLPRLLRSSMRHAVRSGHVGNGLLVVLLALVLGAGWFTDYIGVYSVFGGFVCGLALPRVPGFAALVNVRLLQVTTCLFLPVFFAFSGLNTDLSSVFDGSYLWAFAVMFAAAFSSKFLGALVVLRCFRWGWGESVAMGGLMNARGMMILIFINIGLMLGVIGQGLFSIMVMIAVLTTALAMPIYRSHFTAAREEIARAVVADPPSVAVVPREVFTVPENSPSVSLGVSRGGK